MMSRPDLYQMEKPNQVKSCLSNLMKIIIEYESLVKLNKPINVFKNKRQELREKALKLTDKLTELLETNAESEETTELQKFYLDNAEDTLDNVTDYFFFMPDEGILKGFDIYPEEIIIKLCNLEMWIYQSTGYSTNSSIEEDKARAILLESYSLPKTCQLPVSFNLPKSLYLCCNSLLELIMDYQKAADSDIDSYTKTKKYTFLEEKSLKEREFRSFVEDIENPTEAQKVSIRIAKKVIDNCMSYVYWQIRGRCPDDFYDCLVAGAEPTNKKILKRVFEMDRWIKIVTLNMQCPVDSSEIMTFIKDNSI